MQAETAFRRRPDDAATDLVQLDRIEQAWKLLVAEAFIALALDNWKKIGLNVSCVKICSSRLFSSGTVDQIRFLRIRSTSPPWPGRRLSISSK